MNSSRLASISIVVFCAPVATDWALRFLSRREWDWDIDHMLYFGQRLLGGELHWTESFDDKLPILQFVFALPAAFDSIAVWLTVSVAFVFAGAWGCYVLVEDALRADPHLEHFQRTRYAGITAVAMIYLCTFLPGGIHHINPTAAGAAAASIALLVIACRVRGSSLPAWGPMLASAALASIAIGIRPYFLVPLLSVPFWAFTRGVQSRSLRVSAVSWAVWTAATAIFGLLVNFLPYLISGQFDAFLAGMRMLSQELNPQGTLGVLAGAFITLMGLGFIEKIVILGAIAASIYAVMTLWRHAPGGLPSEIARDILVLSLGLLVLLAASIATKHFWGHYIQMFSPFLGIGFGFLCYAIARRVSIPNRLLGNATGAVAVLAVLGVLPILASDTRALFKHHAHLPRELEAEAIAGFLDTRPADHRDFLYLDNMYVHWRLDEPRQGFPHAANTIHIIVQGWWRSVDMPDWFAHPTSALGYCTAIDEHGPSLIIVGQPLSNFAESCLSHLPRYRLLKELEADTRIYERL